MAYIDHIDVDHMINARYLEILDLVMKMRETLQFAESD